MCREQTTGGRDDRTIQSPGSDDSKGFRPLTCPRLDEERSQSSRQRATCEVADTCRHGAAKVRHGGSLCTVERARTGPIGASGPTYRTRKRTRSPAVSSACPPTGRVASGMVCPMSAPATTGFPARAGCRAMTSESSASVIPD